MYIFLTNLDPTLVGSYIYRDIRLLPVARTLISEP